MSKMSLRSRNSTFLAIKSTKYTYRVLNIHTSTTYYIKCPQFFNNFEQNFLYCIWARNFKKAQAKKLVKSNKSFFREIAFLALLKHFPSSKNEFLVIFEMAKNGIWSKMIVKLIYLITRVFLDCTFLDFLAHCEYINSFSRNKN